MPRIALLAALAAGLLVPGAAAAPELRYGEVRAPIDAARTLAGGVRVLPPQAAPFRFDLVGVRWRGAGDVWFRTKSGSGWSGWRPARPEAEDLPDPGSPERRAQKGWTIGNPWWTGPATAVQLRISGRVTAVRTSFVRSEGFRPRRPSIAAAPAIVSRAAWLADESIVRRTPETASRVAIAIVHHTAGRKPASPGESAAIVRAIQTYHVKTNGWNDIGYNFLVDPFGQVFEGRGGGVDANVIGAHAEGFNTGSVGIAVLGTYTGEDATPAARAALEALIAWRLDLAHVDPGGRTSFRSSGNSRFPAGSDVPLEAVSGHRDTGATSCPGGVLYGRLAEIALLSRIDQSSAMNSSTVKPACVMIERTVPGGISRAPCTGTLTLQGGVPGFRRM